MEPTNKTSKRNRKKIKQIKQKKKQKYKKLKIFLPSYPLNFLNHKLSESYKLIIQKKKWIEDIQTN